jgi:hypothetical protein
MLIWQWGVCFKVVPQSCCTYHTLPLLVHITQLMQASSQARGLDTAIPFEIGQAHRVMRVDAKGLKLYMTIFRHSIRPSAAFFTPDPPRT